MPVNSLLAHEQYNRYIYARDTAHMDFLQKADRCSLFVFGKQWREEDIDKLRRARRPALTLNKTFITLQSILGEQIDTRSEIAYKARYGAPPGNAEALTKVFRYISDINQLNWIRTDLFTDGAITSRAYYDVRMDFTRSTTGEVAIRTLNPKNVLPDPDATAYDPDTWADVIHTQWMSPDEIELHYGKEDADLLTTRGTTGWIYDADLSDTVRDRFGGNGMIGTQVTENNIRVARLLRIIDRQYWKLTKVKYLVDLKTGDKRRVPDAWGPQHIADARALNPNLVVSEETGRRLRWTVTCDNVVLHDDWSPYQHFTIVPYFPFFRYGRTSGLIEHLLDPQELLNKSTSQEMHVINTTANSGYKIRKGVLTNMEPEELEERGAESGIVIEVDGDPEKDVVKITPNQIPQGLDRLSFKAEKFIKDISGRGDSQMGLDRADVSGKAIDKKQQSSDVTIRGSFDNLERTDWILARNILDLIQEYYTDARVMNITHNDLAGDIEEFAVNTPDPETGELLNDLTLGDYDVVVVSSPARRTLEESQFEQAVAMRTEIGIPIPDEFILENSNLLKKSDIIKAIRASKESPEAQLQAKIALLNQQLETANLKAQTAAEEAQALHTRAKAVETMASAKLKSAEAEAASGGQDAEMVLSAQKHEQEMQQKREMHEQEMQMRREEHQLEQQTKRAEAIERVRAQKVQTVLAARQAAQNPKQAGPSKQPQAA